MNPAALKVYLPRLEPGSVVVVNSDAFTKGNLRKAGYDENPLEDAELAQRYRLHTVPCHVGDAGRPGGGRSRRAAQATLQELLRAGSALLAV